MLWSGIDPSTRQDWLLENALVVIALLLLIFTYRRYPLSPTSYLLIFLFLCLHELGAHWTYSNVPYDDWWESIFGVTLTEIANLQRNHFDRLIHFTYGLLLFCPIREAVQRDITRPGFWSYFIPLNIILSTSLLYELIEWAAAEIFGGDLGEAFLGTQGDTWDAHKDMALAGLGALIAIGIIAALPSNKAKA